MSDFLQLAVSLIIILSAAKIAGQLSIRFGQPSVFGELLVGIFLGPSLINLINLPFMTDSHLITVIDHLGEIGVLLLMFLAGAELHLRDLAKSSRVAMVSGSLGVVFPVIMSYFAALAVGMEQKSALFLGLTLAATSVSISAHTLMEMGYLKTKVGLGLLGAAVYDDILVILLLSIFVAGLEGSVSLSGILILVGRMLLFFLLAGLVGYLLLPKMVRRVGRTDISQGLVTFTLVILLLYGVSAEVIGNMAAITGTFFAGLFFSRLTEKEEITQGIQNLAYGFFVPIFFVSIGLKTNLHTFSLQLLGILVLFTVIAIISKLIGSGLGARFGGLPWLESYQLGTGMISRGEVGLIVASIGAHTGLISSELLTIVVVLIMLTTLITPILLKLSFTNPPVFLSSKQVSIASVEIDVEEVK